MSPPLQALKALQPTSLKGKKQRLLIPLCILENNYSGENKATILAYDKHALFSILSDLLLKYIFHFTKLHCHK